MNTLAVQVLQENGLSFELLVDGEPISKHLNDGNGGIPHWIVGDGLPTWPPTGTNADAAVRIVSVCGCGEYGCGHTRCAIRRDGEVVVFENFAGDVGSRGSGFRFVFPASEYDEVSSVMAERTLEYKPDA